MTKLNPYLNFENNCAEAMTFYRDCLGGELDMQLVSDTPIAEKMPESDQNKILHSSLKKGDITIYASDNMHDTPIKGTKVSLCLDCESEEEINRYFTNLSQGGEVGHVLEEQFWGAIFGDLKDKFGIQWLFNYDKNIREKVVDKSNTQLWVD